MQNRNTFPLSPKDGNRESPFLQLVLWAPNNPTKSSQALPGAHVSNAKTGSQAIAFVYENDVYYKPKVQNDLVCRITTTGIVAKSKFSKSILRVLQRTLLFFHQERKV